MGYQSKASLKTQDPPGYFRGSCVFLAMVKKSWDFVQNNYCNLKLHVLY